MTEQRINSDSMLGESYKKNTTLQLVEYFSAGGAVFGLIAALAKQSILFSAAPLTLSVVLNLLSRQQLNQLTRQRAFADTTEVHRRISAEVQGLRGQVQELPAFEGMSGLNTVQASVNALADQVMGLQQQVEGEAPAQAGSPGSYASSSGASTVEMIEFRNKQLDLEQALDVVERKLRSIPTADRLNTLQKDITALQIAIAQLEQNHPPSGSPGEAMDLARIRNELQNLLTPVQDQVSELSARMEHQPAPVEQQSAPAAALALHSQVGGIGQVQRQVESLRTGLDELKVNFSGIQGNLESTQGQVKNVQQQIVAARLGGTVASAGQTPEDLYQQIQLSLNPLQDQVSALETRLNQMPQTGAEPQQLEASTLTPLQDQLRALEERFNQMSTGDGGTPSAAPEQVQELKGQLEHLGDRIEAVSIDLGGVHRTVEETQAQVQAVQAQLSTVHQAAVDAGAPMDPEQLEQQLQATITPLQAQLSGLEGRLDQLPVSASDAGQPQLQQVQGLQGQLAHLKERVDKLSVRIVEDLESMPKLMEERIDRRVAELQPVAAMAAPALEESSAEAAGHHENREDLTAELDSIVSGL